MSEASLLNFSLPRGALTAFALIAALLCRIASGQDIAVYSSSEGGGRLANKPGLRFSPDNAPSESALVVNDRVRFQMIDGFGASFNEAGMICLNSLDAAARDEVLRMLFDEVSGAGFTLMKAPIAACDFTSAGPWHSYNDTAGDTAMQHFSIQRDLDENGMIPFIKQASRFGKFEIESVMDFAPDWMYYSLAPGQKHIRPEYYPALARYYVKYLQAYAAQGITINYLNLFNEADNGHYSNVTYRAMGEMIKDHVAPQLKAEGLSTRIQLGETKTRPEGLEKFPEVLADPEVRKHISGLTVHGYDWRRFSSLSQLHARFPGLPIWMTEVCYARTVHPPGGRRQCPVYEFSDGEFWGNMIANDMKNWVSGWIYWNIILDQDGGPWLVSPAHGDPPENRQHPVVIVNRETNEVTYTGLYYYLAHFSRFVRPGAYRIACEGWNTKLNAVAFQNADGSIVLNIVNNGPQTDCRISWNSTATVQTLDAHSITTLKWSPAPPG